MKKHEFRRTFYQSGEKRLHLQYLLSWSDDGNWTGSKHSAGVCIYSGVYRAVLPVAGAGMQEKQKIK